MTTASDAPVGLAEVNRLRAAGLIPADGYLAAAQAVRDDGFWAAWARRALVALGAGQLLAGIVFFFAYNWADMPAMAKFAVVEVALVGAVAAALLVGLDRLVGQALLIGATVLVGVLLAVVGQVYQTGADSFELFVAWAALILPWTLAARSPAHWLVWLVVTELALTSYGEQVLLIDGSITEAHVVMLLGATTAAALAARELAVGRGVAWLGAHWTRLILVFTGLAQLFWPAVSYLLDGDLDDEPLAIVAFLAALGGLAYFYGAHRSDFAAIAIGVGFTDLFLIAVGFKLIEETVGFDWLETAEALLSTGLMVAWCVASTGAAALLLQNLQRRMQERPA